MSVYRDIGPLDFEVIAFREKHFFGGIVFHQHKSLVFFMISYMYGYERGRQPSGNKL